LLLILGNIRAQQVALAPTPVTPVGEWLFDDPQNLLKSSVGNALELVGTHAAVSGPLQTDGAVRIGLGSHYTIIHGIAPNNGTKVNTYSLCYDFKVNTIGIWYSFLQTTVENNDDGELFVDKTGHLGVRSTGYSPEPIVAGEWNRMVVVVNNGVEYSIYLNGVKFLTGVVQDIDGRFALNPTVLLMADEDGEDNELDVARISIYDKALTGAQVASLGGYQKITGPFLTKPYLQNATTESIAILFESSINTPATINYGPTKTYGSSVTSTVTPTITNTYIHKAVISSLKEAANYYYQVSCDNTPSSEQSFKTATSDVNTPFTVGIWGDSHYLYPFSKMASYLVKDLNVDFCFSSGDVSNAGSDYSDLKNVFLSNTLDTIGSKVPFYISFGNHDVNAQLNGTDLIRQYVAQPADYNSDASKKSGSFAYVYGNSVFIAIDYARYSADLAPNGWLETFLKSEVSKQAKFRFIFVHCPPYFERWQAAEEAVVKTNLPPLCKKYGVTAVFSGHMHGYERGVLDGVQYITQGGASYMDITEPVGPTIYPHIIVGTNKPNNPANFNNGLTNHVLTLEVTPTTATSKLHYFDATGKYLGVIESVEMTPRAPQEPNAVNLPGKPEFSVLPNPTKGMLNIKVSGNVHATVFDLQGKKVFSKSNLAPESVLNLTNLNQGVYLIKLVAGQNEFTKTIVI